ncbi:MAG: hypothetical protein ACLRZH_15075 [Ruthenibacterium lactatiformans]
MKHAKRIAALCLAAALFLTGCASGASGSAAFSPENPVTVTVWHYYNGPQQQAFADLVNEFNETVGREKGIAVQQSSQATVTDLETSVLAAANREVGAPEVPHFCRLRRHCLCGGPAWPCGGPASLPDGRGAG